MIRRFLLLAAASTVFLSCSKSGAPRRQSDWTERLAAIFEVVVGPEQLRVVDTTGKPIANAQILIGSGLNQPFAENFIASSADGGFKAPSAWTTAQPITISAPGFVRATYFGQTPNGQTYTLRPAISPKLITLSGETSGHKVTDGDDIVDFAVVIPSMTKRALFNFDISAFISPETETITVVGNDLNVPKNISLPEQHESYFFPIEFNKPGYSLSFRQPGDQMVYVARGHFPLDEVVNEFRAGKEFYELTNYFSITGGALRLINLQGDTTLNLPVTELNYSTTRALTAPKVASDQVVLSAALATWKGWYYPTDVKLLDSGKARNMTIAAGGTPYLISILKKKDEMSLDNNVDRLSANFATFNANVTPDFLPLLEKPTVKSYTNFEVKPIAKPANVFEGAQFSVLSKVTTNTVGTKKIDVLENIWEVYSPQWMAQTSIPVWPGEKTPTGRLRWEVTLTALPSQNAVQNVELGSKWLDAASHATRCSQDF